MIRAGSADDVQRVIDRIAEHVAAELTSDAPTISATIGADPFFPVLVRGGDGIDLIVLTDPEETERFYAARVTTFEILDTTRITEIRTDWYALHESIATVRHSGDYNGIPPTGSTHRVHSAVLFPTGDDGIVGELEWTHFDFADIFRGLARRQAAPEGPEAFLPLDRLAAARAHERLVGAWWSGDVDGVTAEVVEDCRWASRHVHGLLDLPALSSAIDAAGVATIVQGFADGRVLRSTRLQCSANEWYSFGEWKLTIDVGGAQHDIRVASLVPVGPDGRFLGHLAYCVDAG